MGSKIMLVVWHNWKQISQCEHANLSDAFDALELTAQRRRSAEMDADAVCRGMSAKISVNGSVKCCETSFR
jgi:hypothetical protein